MWAGTIGLSAPDVTRQTPGHRAEPGARAPLVVGLRKHGPRQREARVRARTLWCDRGLVLTTITGRPVAPRDHSLHRTAFLEGLGIRPARLRDARHTAATLLLVQGVDRRAVMSMFGWTSPAMTTRYQNVVPELVEEANRRMSELLWGDTRATGERRLDGR